MIKMILFQAYRKDSNSSAAFNCSAGTFFLNLENSSAPSNYSAPLNSSDMLN